MHQLQVNHAGFVDEDVAIRQQVVSAAEKADRTVAKQRMNRASLDVDAMLGHRFGHTHSCLPCGSTQRNVPLSSLQHDLANQVSYRMRLAGPAATDQQRNWLAQCILHLLPLVIAEVSLVCQFRPLTNAFMLQQHFSETDLEHRLLLRCNPSRVSERVDFSVFSQGAENCKRAAAAAESHCVMYASIDIQMRTDDVFNSLEVMPRASVAVTGEIVRSAQRLPLGAIAILAQVKIHRIAQLETASRIFQQLERILLNDLHCLVAVVGHYVDGQVARKPPAVQKFHQLGNSIRVIFRAVPVCLKLRYPLIDSLVEVATVLAEEPK